jgi:predicted phosphodiesterase
MDLLNISVPSKSKLCVVGDIHEHDEQFMNLYNQFKDREDIIVVSCGDILEKGFGRDSVYSIISAFQKIIDDGRGYVIKGNHEIRVMNRIKGSIGPRERFIDWFYTKPLALSFKFYNGTRVTVVHGGVKPAHTMENLRDDIETCYIRCLDSDGKKIKMLSKIVDGRKKQYLAKPGDVWHKSYDGRLGYIISGHNSQKDGIPKFYNYSCNIDTACYHTGKLTALLYGAKGREEILTFEGKARFPNLDKMEQDMANGQI